MKTIETLDNRPFRRLITTIGALPTSFIDSMSYYEMLAWFCDFLQNTVIPAVNDNAEALAELQRLFVELKEYVDNYFDNLDVQEEINNKLDAMVEDGTFESIIDDYLDTYYRNQPLVKEYIMNRVFACPFLGSDDARFGMQGGCVLPDGSFIQYTGESHKLQKWGQDGTLILEVNGNYGHGNGLTYCDETNTLFITPPETASVGVYVIYEISATTLTLVNTYNVDNFPAQPDNICYDNENKQFIFTDYWQKNNIGSQHIWATNLDFEVTNSKTVSFNVSGISNIGMVFDRVGVVVIQNNEILEFDPTTLNFVTSSFINQKIGDVWYTNENEWIDTRNGKLYGGFICGETNVFGVYEPELAYQPTNLTAVFSKNNQTYYVDYNANDPFRNGTQAHPFENIVEAINASQSSDDFGARVTINLSNATARNQKVVFTGNKTFALVQAGNIVCIGQLRVDERCTVYTSSPIILQGISDDTTSLHVGGTLYCDFIDMYDNSDLIITGGRYGYIQGAFNYGIDVTGYKGTIECVGNTLDNASITGLTTSGFYLPAVKNYDIRLQPNEGETHKFQLPRMSRMLSVMIRFSDTVGDHEHCYLVTYGRYSNYIINDETTITIQWNGLVTISSNTTNVRVIVSGI